MTALQDLENRRETFWINPDRQPLAIGEKVGGYGFAHVKAAQQRMMRFMPYIERAFPETAARKGVIESKLIEIPAMKAYINEHAGHGAAAQTGGPAAQTSGTECGTAAQTGAAANIPQHDGLHTPQHAAATAAIEGRLFLKDDAHLPIAGSVKARGGIHEVMKIAEYVGQKEDKLWPSDDYAKIDSDEFREMYSHYTIQVGSTGNLGISIGRMAARLGFRAIVHMSSDAKQWKKDLLRSEGVIVKEYEGDYGEAVAAGRRESAADESSFFVDDENSEALFFGYAAAAMRTKVQLRKKGIPVDEEHPLFLYLPCGVGGAPGGITFGFRQIFGDAVHCFFAEPVEAPCFLLGMASDKGSGICVQDIGLTGHTSADGLAVGRPSELTCRLMRPLVSGAFTVTDEQMAIYQKEINEREGIRLEISACAGFGAFNFADKHRHTGNEATGLQSYIEAHGLAPYMPRATHIVWATGGGLMPD